MSEIKKQILAQEVPLFRPGEARQFLGINERTLDLYVECGLLPVAMVLPRSGEKRFHLSDLQALKNGLPTPYLSTEK